MRIRLFLALTTALVTAAGPFARAQEADNAPAPPSRVGQIAQVQGGVSFNGGGTDGWTAASLDSPVSTGDSLYTQPDASTNMTVDSSRIALAGGTELQITQLDDSTLAATESQGEAWLDLRYLQAGQQFIIATPRGNVTITRAGRYDLIAGDANTPTQVTVLYGAASIANSDEQLNIAAGQTATLSGSAPVSASVGGAIRDGFIDQQIAAAEPAPPSYAPPAVQQMTGAYELSNYGQWSQTPQYGAVWYPQVAPGWVPYREGHWAYVAP
ncbi:MAG TPA: hypothetical protein PLI12_01625 [Acetobacteraceae bacterium]|nr:hypothetical protein [Acetobacteraceae bacterium]